MLFAKLIWRCLEIVAPHLVAIYNTNHAHATEKNLLVPVPVQHIFDFQVFIVFSVGNRIVNKRESMVTL